MKELTSTALADLAKAVGGVQWVETLDVFCGASVPSDCQAYMRHCTAGAQAGWHLLVCNADCICAQTALAANETWTDGKRFYPIPYGREDVAEQTGANGAIVTTITVGDAGGKIAALMDALHGLAGYPVTLALHYASGLANNVLAISYPELAYEFTVKTTMHDGLNTKISISADIPLERQWPPRHMYKAACRWVFKGCECQYVGNDTSCLRTIAACVAKGNIVHFGGFPGCGTGGLAQ